MLLWAIMTLLKPCKEKLEYTVFGVYLWMSPHSKR